MTYIIKDHRTRDMRPVGSVGLWMVATDKIMSGWGQAPSRSLVAYPADGDHKQLGALYKFCDDRSDYQRVRTNIKLPRLYDRDHLSIYDVPSWITNEETDDEDD